MSLLPRYVFVCCLDFYSLYYCMSFVSLLNSPCSPRFGVSSHDPGICRTSLFLFAYFQCPMHARGSTRHINCSLFWPLQRSAVRLSGRVSIDGLRSLALWASRIVADPVFAALLHGWRPCRSKPQNRITQ
jgi:hypothetical protein